MHVAEGGVDSTLGGDGMRPRGEQFGDAGSFKSLLDKSKGSSESCSSGANDNSIKGMINDSVFFKELVLSQQ